MVLGQDQGTGLRAFWSVDTLKPALDYERGKKHNVVAEKVARIPDDRAALDIHNDPVAVTVEGCRRRRANFYAAGLNLVGRASHGI
jgi:hypothetical protein